jgi:hypothetical protein
MSTFIELSSPMLEDEPGVSATVEVEPEVRSNSSRMKAAPWSPGMFAEEQMRSLVRQVFLPGWPNPSHQVLFTAVDPETEITEVCMRVGQTLAEQSAALTCVVEAEPDTAGLEDTKLHNGFGGSSSQKRFGALRDSSQQVSDKLWFMPQDVFMGGNDGRWSAVWLRARLAELRLEFDYTVLRGPAAATCSESALLGKLCDGAVLVLQANSTRRVTAQKVKERLQAANVRLLGAVLSERIFPVPEVIYRRL